MRHTDPVTGTTSNFGFTDSQTIPLPVRTLVSGAVFSGAFSGNVITGLFTNTEHIAPCPPNNACDGSGTAPVTLVRQ